MAQGSWRHHAEAEQQRLGDMLGKHLRVFPRSRPLLLKWSVGFALFGPPSHVPTDINGSSASKEHEVGYTALTLKSIDAVCNTILKHQSGASEVLMSVTFVAIKANDKPLSFEPVFRVPKYMKKGVVVEGQNLFVDSGCRVYDSWDDYLCNNTLAEGWFCYPQGGVYQQGLRGRVVVCVSQSPAGKLHRKVLNGLDVASSAVGIGASVAVIGTSALTIAAVAIPAAAVVAGGAAVAAVASSVYGVGRSISQLVDRGLHKEKVRVSDVLPVVGGVIGIAAAGSNQLLVRAAQRGATVGAVRSVIANGLSIGSVVVNGASVASIIYTLVSKYTNSEKITVLDILQFTVSFFFFTHSVLTFETASDIIRQAQQLLLADIEHSLPDEDLRRLFIKMSKTIKRSMPEQEANAKIIKAFRNLDTIDDFLNYLEVLSKNCKTSSLATQSRSGGVLNPHKFNDYQRKAFLKGVRNIVDGKWGRRQFYDNTEMFFGNNFEVYIKCFDFATAFTSLGDVNNFTGVVKTGLTILQNLSPECRLSLRNMILDWVKYVGCDYLGALVEFCEFAYPYVSSVLQDMVTEYENLFQQAVLDDPKLSRQEFDMSHGVEGNTLEHFFRVFTIVYKTVDKLSQLKDAYKEFRESKLFAAINSESTSDAEQPVDEYETENGSKLWVVEWDFKSSGDPLSTSCYEIAAMILNVKVDANTSYLMHSGEMTFVTLVGDDRSVLIRRMKDRNELLVSVATEGECRAVVTSSQQCHRSEF